MVKDQGRPAEIPKNSRETSSGGFLSMRFFRDPRHYACGELYLGTNVEIE